MHMLLGDFDIAHVGDVEQGCNTDTAWWSKTNMKAVRTAFHVQSFVENRCAGLWRAWKEWKLRMKQKLVTKASGKKRRWIPVNASVVHTNSGLPYTSSVVHDEIDNGHDHSVPAEFKVYERCGFEVSNRSDSELVCRPQQSIGQLGGLAGQRTCKRQSEQPTLPHPRRSTGESSQEFSKPEHE